jgi:hypothetical protein
MRYLRNMDGNIKRDRIRNQTIRMGLGISLLKEMIKLAQLRWFGQVVSMGNETPKCPGKPEYTRRGPKETPTGLGRRDTEDFERE